MQGEYVEDFGGSFAVSVAVHGTSVAVQVSRQTLVRELQLQLEQLTGIPVEAQRLLHEGRQIKEVARDAVLGDVGIGPAACKMRLLQHTAQEEVHELDRILDKHKAQQEQQRQYARNGAQSATHKRHKEYSFQQFRVLPHHQTPAPSQAMELLHKLADDRAICHIMEKYKWRVGLLSEMEPEGKVGVSEVCILGFNKGRGMEISLRLRTDDLKGFRRYDTIKDTLLHELSHMVYDQHNKDFFDFLRVLQQEYQKWDWNSSSSGYRLSGDHYRANTQPRFNTQSARGQTTGGHSPSTSAHSPSLAAADAAISRTSDAKALSSERLNSEQRSSRQMTQQDDALSNPAEKLTDAVAVMNYGNSPQNEPTPQQKIKVSSELIDPIILKIMALRESRLGNSNKVFLDNNPSIQTAAEASESLLARYNQALERFLTALVAHAQSDSERETALQTISQCIKNVALNPTEPRFKRIRLSNPAFLTKLARFDGALDYLVVAGFIKDERGEHLQMSVVDPATLWMGQSLIDECIAFLHGHRPHLAESEASK